MNHDPQSQNYKDPYQFHAEDVSEPPRGLANIFRQIGPGMILAASIVGSGELIATTTLGAETGYAALWVIMLSCLLKPLMQSELGRFTIATGETGLGALNLVPGPRISLGRQAVGWVPIAWMLMVMLTRFQIGAMFGGVAQALSLIFPAVPEAVWVVPLFALTLYLLLGGGYERVEGLATIKVCLFTLLTCLCAVLLTRRSDLFSWQEVAQGFRFELPAQGLASAIAVFGITGVGASELFMYPYWCVEKGYARYAGKRDDSPAWQQRALGWIRVMNLDILVTMFIYTLATIAFYLLGAGILNKQGLVPKGSETIAVLSRMYTDTLGWWGVAVFYVGAIATLYGTIFAATAADSRVFSDLCRIAGYYEREDFRSRNQYRKVFVIVLSGVPVVLYYVFRDPVGMVKLGGLAQACLLPCLAFSCLYLKYQRLPRLAASGPLASAGLWLVCVTTILLMSYYVTITIVKLTSL
jgi:manganese transport protein